MSSLVLACLLALSLRGAIPTAYSVFGPSKAYRGQGSTYVSVRVRVDVDSAVYIYDLQGLPAGATFKPWCYNFPQTVNCWGPVDGKYYQYTVKAANTEGPNLYIRITASSSVATGTYPLKLHLSSNSASCVLGTNCTEVPFDLHVVDAPPAPPANLTLAFTPVPAAAKAKWENFMWASSTGGSHWVPTDPPPWMCSSANHESAVWYYDGARNYYWVADYLGLPAAAATADVINKACAPYYTKESHGWHSFPQGLHEGWIRTGNTAYRDAVRALTTTAYAAEGGRPMPINKMANDGCWATYDRETVYLPQAFVYSEKAGAARQMSAFETDRTQLAVAVDKSLMVMEQMISPTNQIVEFQSWIYGLGMQSLIEYYEWTKGEPGGPDTRVLDAVKTGVDWAWRHRGPDAYGLGGGAVLNNPYAAGSGYVCNSSGGGQKYILLNNAFIMHAAAWYWRKTGDNAYRDIADTLFADAMQTNGFDTAKQWSQEMRGSFLYYGWRTAPGAPDPPAGVRAVSR